MARNNLSRRNSTSQPGFSGNLLTVANLETQETNPRMLALKPENVSGASSGPALHTQDKRQTEGKAGQLWGWLARRVVASRSNSLHISVVSEEEEETEKDGVGRKEEETDWLQDQFEGMTYEEIAVWVKQSGFV